MVVPVLSYTGCFIVWWYLFYHIRDVLLYGGTFFYHIRDVLLYAGTFFYHIRDVLLYGGSCSYTNKLNNLFSHKINILIARLTI